jgi:hypothetical protein
MFELNIEYVDWYFEAVIRLIAKDLKIDNWGIDTPNDLKKNIENINPKINKLMNGFFAEYSNWFNAVNANEEITQDSIIAREKSLNDLVQALKN